MKKIISIILAAAMMLSLIPSVFAEGETDKLIKIVYNFKSEGVFEEDADEFDLTKLSYDASNGFWAFGGSSAGNEVSTGTSGVRFAETANVGDDGTPYCLRVNATVTSATYWIAYKLYVPKVGNYSFNLSVTNNFSSKANAQATNINAFVFKATEEADIENIISGKEGELNGNCTAKQITETIELGSEELDEGEYYFVVYPYTTGDKAAWLYPHSLTLTENGTGEALVPIISSLTKTSNGDGTTTVEAEAKKMSDAVTDATEVTYSYAVASDDSTLAEVDDEKGIVTGLADGTATIIATATAPDGLSSSKSIEVEVTAPVVEPEETEAYVNAFTPSSTVENSTPANADVIPLAYATDGSDIAPANIEATDNGNGTYAVATDAEVNGYKFRYWAKGLESKDRKRIVSFANEFTYTPSNEKNYLIAVYDKAGTAATTEYYNANGQLIQNADDSTKVYMAGYGESTGWKEPVYGIKEAIYGEPLKYNITTGNAEPVEYAWGTPVVCPEQTAPEGQEFWGWKKTVNNVDVGIVSTDPEYTFYAWETCTVTPVFGVGTPVFGGEKRRIILGTFLLGGKTAVMAEFFGFDDAVERGITIDGTDYAMTNKNAKQFTIVDDDSKGNISGYAILANGTKYIYNYNTVTTAE